MKFCLVALMAIAYIGLSAGQVGMRTNGATNIGKYGNKFKRFIFS